jgi:hypothetical protein
VKNVKYDVHGWGCHDLGVRLGEKLEARDELLIEYGYLTVEDQPGSG